MHQLPAMPILKNSSDAAELPVLTEDRFDLEEAVSISLIRQHTKTDDVPHVTDALLSMYRNAAFEAAEQYTGLLLRKNRVIHQSVASKRSLWKNRWRSEERVRLQYPTADGILYLYGGKQALQTQVIRTNPGATSVVIPINHFDITAEQCCAPNCGNAKPANSGMMLMYKAGLASATDIPSCVVMGVLKYIAWVISNPGDEPLASVNLANVNPQAGRNNTAWQSGAIEEWRLCDGGAF